MQKSKVLSIILGTLFSIILTISFLLLAMPNLDKKAIKLRQMHDVNSSAFREMISLPQKQNYVFKIKYEFKNADIESVSLNGNRLKLRVSNKRNFICARYYYAPQDIVNEGENILKIHFYPGFPPNVDIRIRNYIASTEDKNIILTMRGSLINQKDFVGLMPIAIFFFIFSFCLWWGYIYFGRIFNLPLNGTITNNIITFLPCTLLYFVFGIASISTPYSLAITPSYLFVSLFTITLVVIIPLNLLSVFFLRQTPIETIQDDKILHQTRKIKRHELPKWLEKFLSWIKSREFSDKCILFFMFLLIMCAFLLILSLEWLAKQSANAAYFTLVIGVVIKFAKFAREERKKE